MDQWKPLSDDHAFFPVQLKILHGLHDPHGIPLCILDVDGLGPDLLARQFESCLLHQVEAASYVRGTVRLTRLFIR